MKLLTTVINEPWTRERCRRVHNSQIYALQFMRFLPASAGRETRHYGRRANLSRSCPKKYNSMVAGINQRISPLMHIDDFYGAIIFARLRSSRFPLESADKSPRREFHSCFALDGLSSPSCVIVDLLRVNCAENPSNICPLIIH